MKTLYPECGMGAAGESEDRWGEITRLECNLDDMTGEEIGFAMNQLFREGARDVYTQAIGMKKSRPGVLLSVICLPGDADRMAEVIMKYTTTLGIRRQDMSRYCLKRSIGTAETPYGPVRVKTASGMGVHRSKAEYDDLAALAEKNQVSLETIRKAMHPCSAAGDGDGAGGAEPEGHPGRRGPDLRLEKIKHRLTVCKVPELSGFDMSAGFYFIGRTDEELSLVCRTEDTPAGTTAREDGWRGFRVQGTLDFSLTGILARLSGILAAREIGIFAVSTYNTDYILVKKENYARALEALAAEGYTVAEDSFP